MRKFIPLILCCCLSALLLVLTARAQGDTLDPTLPPEHGTAILGADFSPDPFRGQSIQGGGSVEIASQLRGSTCVGNASPAPDYRIELRDPLPLLRLIFVADTVTADAMMVVRTPDGQLLCGDDSYGVLAPTIDVTPAPAGDYLVWIGAFTEQPVYGSLYVTRRDDVYPNSISVVVPRVTPTPAPPDYTQPTTIPGTTLDVSAPPRYGSVSLTPDYFPYWHFVEGGGSLDVPAFDLQADEARITFGQQVGSGSLGAAGSGECAGFTTADPTFTFTLPSDLTHLRVLFVAVTAPDATSPVNPSIAIHAPDDLWYCNRDFSADSLDPVIDFDRATAGDYAVWVADETRRDTAIPGALVVSDDANLTPDSASIPADQPLIIPLDVLTTGASPVSLSVDPLLIPVAGGGAVDPSAGKSGSECPGTYPAQESAAVTLTRSLAYVRVFVANPQPESADPTLVALMPDGHWYCADDWGGTTNPLIDIWGETGTGTAHFWVGSYNAGETFQATLGITQGDASPIHPTIPGLPAPG